VDEDETLFILTITDDDETVGVSTTGGGTTLDGVGVTVVEGYGIQTVLVTSSTTTTSEVFTTHSISRL